MKESDAKRIRLAMQNGQLDMDDPEVLEVSRRSVDLAAELKDLRGLQDELEREGFESRAVIQSAHSAVIEEGDLRLLQSLPDVAVSQNPRRLPWWLPLAAAGALLVAWWSWQASQSNQAQASPMLQMPAKLTLLGPIGIQADWSRFEWEGPVQSGAWFVVYATDLDSGDNYESPKLDEPVWEPTTALPGNRLQWRVVWFSGKGQDRVSSDTAEIER